MKFTDFAAPSITDLERKYVNAVMESGWEGKDKYLFVERFEHEIAEWVGRKYAILVTNATSAIYLILKAIGIGPDDEVVVPELTWCASAFPATELGATVKFCDVHPETWCWDDWTQETEKTKAIIPVNLYGNMVNWDKYERLGASQPFIIEDAAESMGSMFKGRKSGTFGNASVFSFHRTKTVTMGEGGVILTNDKELYEKCYVLRDLGRGKMTGTYLNEISSLKFMPTNLLAALGCAQLARLEELIGRKRDQFKLYRKILLSKRSDLLLNQETDSNYNSCWATNVVWPAEYGTTSLTVIERMGAKGIPVRPMFYPLSSIPAYNQRQDYEYVNKNAYSVYWRGVNLPCTFSLSQEQQIEVCEVFIEVLGSKQI